MTRGGAPFRLGTFRENLLALSALWLLCLVVYTTYGSPWTNLTQSWLPDVFRPDAGVLARHFLRFSAFLFVSFVLAGTGRRVLGLFRRREGDPWSEAALAFGLGYGLWGTGLLLLGLAGLWNRPLLAGLLLAASWPAAGGLRGLLAAFRNGRALPESPWQRAALAAVLAVWLLNLPWMLIPETFYDAQGYHLGLPALYLQEGRIFPTPENSYSGIPSIPMMLYGLALAFDRMGMLAQLLHGGTALAVGAALAGLCAELDGRDGRPDWTPAALFALTPVVISESFRVSVGLEWALFQLLSFRVFLGLPEEGGRGRRGRLMLCGLFLGFAMSSKYPAWFLPLALVSGAAHMHLSGQAPFRLKDALLPAAAAALVLSPWVLKNAWFYGNPVYPFFHETFAPHAVYRPDWSVLSSGSMDVRKVFLTAPGLAELFRRPFEFARHARDLGGATGPLYLGLLPLCFLAPLSPKARTLAVLCAAAWFPLNALSWITRFFIPVLAALAALLAHALGRISHERLRRALGAAAAIALLWTFASYATLAVKRWKNLDVFTGAKDPWTYLGHVNHESFYPTPPHAGFRYIHQRAPAEAKVLVFGDARHFPLWRAHIASSADQRSVLEVWANASADAEALRRRFADAGVTYVVVNHAEIFRNSTAFRFSPKGKAVLDAFWKKYALRELQSAVPNDYWVEVYRILDEEEAAAPHPVHDLWAIYRVKR